MDWETWLPIGISAAALIFSGWTFFSNRNRNKFKVKFYILNTYSTVNDGIFVKVAVENESVNPISIIKFSIDSEYSNTVPTSKQIWTGPNKFLISSKIPTHLNSYEAKNVLIFFKGDYNFIRNKDYKFSIYTTRGKKTIKINSNNDTLDSSALAHYEGERI